MKHSTRLCILLIVITGTNLQAQTPRYVEMASTLRDIYKRLNDSQDSLQECREFFEAFPNTFADFDSLYGYEHDPSIMYHEYEAHVENVFRNLHCVSDSAYFKKLIQLGIGGHWEADAVGSLQQTIHERMLANPRLAFQLLANLPPKSVSSFFYFFFNGIHAPYNRIPKEFAALRTTFPQVYQGCEEGFRRGLNDSGH